MNERLNQFYSSAKWRKKREMILRRDNYLCVHCKRYGRLTKRTEVHHILHVDEFPELRFDNDNLVSLCKRCHNKEHPEKGGSKKY